MRTLVALLLLCCGFAHAQSCAPADAVAYNAGVVAGHGRWVRYWCADGWGDWYPVLLAGREGVAIKQVDVKGMSTAQAVRALWDANVTANCETTTDAKLYHLCAVAKLDAWAARPLPKWVVRPSGTIATRPTYAAKNGARVLDAKGKPVVNGSVPMLDAYGRPTPCNPAEKIVEGTLTYMQVKRTAGTLTICSASS